jgi:hypothetical protein
MAICGYICFFTGVPTLIGRVALKRASAAQLRVIALLFFPIVLLVTDIIAYLMAPNSFTLEYSARHVLNPFLTLANWPVAEKNHWDTFAIGIGMIGVASYVALIRMGWRANQELADA